MPLLQRLWQALSQRRKWQFAIVMMLMLAGAAAELITLGTAIPFLTLLTNPERVDEFELLQSLAFRLGLDPNDLLIPTTILFACIAVLAACIRLLLNWTTNRYVHAVGYDFGTQIYKRTLRQPYSWYLTHNSGDIVAAVDKVKMVITWFLKPLMESIIAAVLGLVIFAALLAVNATIAISVAAGLGLVYGLISLTVQKRIHRNGRTIAQGQNKVVRSFQEAFGGIRDVIIDDTYPVYVNRFSKDYFSIHIAQAENAFLSTAPRFVIEGFAIVLLCIVALYLSGQSANVSEAIPILGVFALGGQKLIPQLQLVYHGWTRTVGNSAVLRDILDLLELPFEHPADKEQVTFNQAIELRDITFAYSPQSEPVFRSLNLRIEKDQRVGIIGETGSGKSTLLDIIMGLLAPDKGEICIDGVPLTVHNRKSWQRHISHVPQNIFLSDASIRENIALGIEPEKIDEQKIREAARKAQINDVIAALPDGYDTYVGERGIRLSGGQKQRIAIARAIYRNADVLVLDEATSALDEETEKAVVECIDNLGRNLTVLVIAHRLSTLRNCDVIYKLKGHTLNIMQGNSGQSRDV